MRCVECVGCAFCACMVCVSFIVCLAGVRFVWFSELDDRRTHAYAARTWKKIPLVCHSHIALNTGTLCALVLLSMLTSFLLRAVPSGYVGCGFRLHKNGTPASHCDLESCWLLRLLVPCEVCAASTDALCPCVYLACLCAKCDCWGGAFVSDMFICQAYS